MSQHSIILYRCTKEIWVQKPKASVIHDLEVTTQLFSTRVFTTGKLYTGRPSDQFEPQQEGIRFFNDQGEAHFCSLPFLNEHFVKVEPESPGLPVRET